MSAGALKAIGLIGGLGATAAMASAANRAAAVAERAVALAERNYNEIVVPTWTRMRDLYDRYVASFQSYENTYLAQAQALIFYTPDFATQESRAIAGVSSRFSRLRQRRNRMRLKYNYGLCCHETLMLDIAEARAMTDMVNQGYRFEVNRKERLDEWYWTRQTQGMAMVESLRAQAISGINRGVVAATSGVSATAAASRGVTQAAQAQMGAYESLASQFASMSNGAASFLGFQAGMGGVPTMIPGA